MDMILADKTEDERNNGINMSQMSPSTTLCCYRLSVPLGCTPQYRKYHLSEKVSMGLWKGFVDHNKQRSTQKECCLLQHSGLNTPHEEDNVLTVVRTKEVNTREMPGENCTLFKSAIAKLLHRKQELSMMHGTWIAPSSLYWLWRLSSNVTTELFADSLNNSGVLKGYCSADEYDRGFGSIGSWEEVENSIEGGAGNPPFVVAFINEVLQLFECGIRKDTPYCRCVRLPLGKRYGTTSHCSKPTSESFLLMTIPAGCMAFQNEHELLSLVPRKAKPHMFHSVGLFLWCNRSYHVTNPAPADVEDLYNIWVHHSLLNVERVILHYDVFEAAFPLELRSRKRLGDDFLQHLASDC